jgi:hypothetical protein
MDERERERESEMTQYDHPLKRKFPNTFYQFVERKKNETKLKNNGAVLCYVK